MLDKLVFKNNKVYDILKNIALLLPFFIACYAEIGAIWDIPYTMEIVKTLGAIEVLAGGIVKISSVCYNKTKLIEEYDQEEENSMEIETNELEEDENLPEEENREEE